MDNQMDRTAHVEGLSKMYPILGPAFLVAVGFLDASKWITMIDAGSCFGFELAWLLLLNNLIAILCQSLAVRIGVATSKDLAQICAEEYPRPLCILLWLQCEVSLLALDFAAVLGTAIALHLLLDQEIFCCMMLSMFAVISVPLLLPLMGKRHIRLLSLSMVAMMTLFFIMDALSNNENVAVLVSGLFPKIKRESLYTAASLIGANILPHNFYLHSSLIQEQKKVRNLHIETLSYCNFLEIAFVFSAILLMNASMLSSAATVFHDSGLRVLIFLDIQDLVEQMFRNSFARVVFFLALFCTSQLSALTRTFGGQLAINGFLGANRNWWFNHSSIKACVITLLMSLVWKARNIDVYWFLIFCHVMLALQLPAAVIPLFRVASSKLIMKTYRISQSLEVLCWLSFLWIVIFNLMFLFDILLGNSRWVVSLKYNSGGGISFLYFLILMVASVSLGFMLWLLSTPLNCENQKTIMQSENTCPDMPSEIVEPALGEPSKQEREFEAPDEAKANDVPTFDGSKDGKELNVFFENVLDQRKLPEAQEGTVISSQNMSSKVADSDNEMKSSYIDLQPQPSAPSKEVPSSTAFQTVSDSSSIDNISKPGASLKSDSETGHDDDDVDGWEQEDVPMDIPGSVSPVAFEEPSSYRSTGGRSDEGGSGSGSLSRLAGLGRAARRNFAAILDEFWGKFFDLHGQMTEQARLKRLDLALGLKLSQNQGSLTSNGNVNVANEPKYSVDQEKKPWQNISINVPVIGMTSNVEPRESINTGPSVSRNVYGSSHLSPNSPSCSYSTYSRQSGSALYGGERRYSSLHMPSFKESFSSLPEYQSYQSPPFPSLERKSIGSLGSSSIDSSSASHPVTNPAFRAEDSLRNDMGGSVFNGLQRYDTQNVAFEQTFLQGGQHHYSNKTRSHDYSRTIGQAKKYHSLPDIPYREMMLQWNNFSRQEHDQWYPMAQKAATEIERYESFGSSSFGSAFRHAPISRTDSYNDRMKNHDEKVPLAFDELSPSPLHRDAFSLQATSKAQNTSLWSKQPFEQLFGSSGHKNVVNSSERNGFSRVTPNPRENISSVDIEVEILQNLRCCVTKLLRLEGSEWLFQKKWGFDEERYGFDEELINLVARKEKIDQEADLQNQDQDLRSSSVLNIHEASFGAASLSIPRCGDGCVWGVGLFISFGVWCIHRILELSRMESRPELWGKYTYVLNRLQGILEPAFSKPRFLLSPCFCLQLPAWEEGSGRKLGSSDGSLLNSTVASSVVHSSQGKVPSNKRKATSATVFLEIIKNVEIAVGSRKGRTGTAAGDVAFPKGKENLASVLKRYKRRLSNKPPGSLETNGSKRKAVR